MHKGFELWDLCDADCLVVIERKGRHYVLNTKTKGSWLSLESIVNAFCSLPVEQLVPLITCLVQQNSYPPPEILGP